jgi:3-oxoacyl-[acyl-carrier protein] reductase
LNTNEKIMQKDFAGKTALVTGASRGIGAATAIALARSGVTRVVIQYNSFREGAEKTIAAIREAGAAADSIQADLGAQVGIEECQAAIRATVPEPDILINNAGSLVKRSMLSEPSSELFDRVFFLNTKSVWIITQTVAPAMIAKGAGVVVNVSSIAGRNGGGPGATIYAAAKAAVTAMTKGMAKELAPKGVRVNAISPGTVDNNFHAQFSTRQMLDRMVASTPLGRLGADEDMAGVIVFLCSDAARYIVGQTVEINGGMLMV